MADAPEETPKPRTDVLSSGLSKRWALTWALLLFAIAFGIRLAGIGWGLPEEHRHQSLHPDELLIKEFADRTPYFMPGFYNYGTLYLTSLKISADMGRSYGWVAEGDAVPQWQTDRDIHLSGRVISALAGAATVPIVFLILLQFAGLLGAGVGGLAMMLAPGHVVHSRFQTTDVLATFLIALAALFIACLLTAPPEKRIRFTVLSALAIGLATGTKYTGALLILSLLLALWLLDRKAALKPMAIAVGVFLLAFLATTPGALLETDKFLAGFIYEMRHAAEGHGLVFADTPTGFVYHISNLWAAGGGVLLLFGLTGLIFAGARKEPWLIVFALFFVLYYVLIGRAEVKFLRYVLPLLPFLAVGFGYLMSELHQRGGRYRLGVGALLGLIIISTLSTQGPFRLTQLMSIEDPRDRAAAWLLAEAGPEETIGLVTDPWFYSPPLFPDAGLFGAHNRLRAMWEHDGRLVRQVMPDGTRFDWDPALITNLQPDYIVFSSFEFIDADRVNLPALAEFMPLLSLRYEIVAFFWGEAPFLKTDGQDVEDISREGIRALMHSAYPTIHDMMYIQPSICVFRKKTD